MSLTEETGASPLPPPATDSRVIAHRVVGGASSQRRRTFQKHLLAFLAVSLGAAALDVAVVEPQGLQWAWWIVVPWAIVFAIHLLGLKARGYSFFDLLTPPKTEKVGEDYPVPLDHELVRARQLRDGVERSAASVAEANPETARQALAAADSLLGAIERLVASARGSEGGEGGEGDGGSHGRAERLVPELREAVELLGNLHEGLIAQAVLDEPPQELPIAAVEHKSEALGKSSA